MWALNLACVCREAEERAGEELQAAKNELDRLRQLEEELTSALKNANSRVDSLRDSGAPTQYASLLNIVIDHHSAPKPLYTQFTFSVHSMLCFSNCSSLDVASWCT